MDSQRCPLCGQANPPHLEVCQYCQARLKPLWIEIPDETSSKVEGGVTKSKTPLEPDEPLLPDWLMASRMQMVEGQPSPAEEPEQPELAFPQESPETEIFLTEEFLEQSPESKADDIPEWLRDLRGDSASEEGESPPSDFSGETTPYWLDFDESGIEKTALVPSSGDEEVPPFVGVPFEWIDIDFATFKSPEEGDKESISPEEPQAVPPFEMIEPMNFEEEAVPVQEDILFPVEPIEKPPIESEKSLSAEVEDWMSEIPPWLETLPGQEWVEGETAGREMPPEFLQGVVPPFVETEEELSEIEFPAWLDELERSIEPELGTVIESLTPTPVEMLSETEIREIPQQESVEAPPREEIPVEVVGPLHGLRGVLPAEPLVAEQKKPTKALSDLLVTDKQRAQAELFLKLIEEESKSKPISPTKRAKPHTLWRVLIFLILFFVAAVGLILRPFSTAPIELSVGVFDAMQAVSQLPTEATVLLIVDMDGGDFAEMQATTQSMLDQMMVRGAFFVLVSANHTGALQADRLLRETSRLRGHSYQSWSGWVNLGYLPGGVAGMQAFSQSLTDVLPNTVDGEAAWQNERLQRIRSLADFDLVVVITEDSTRARQWIEQLKGKVSESRLVFAVSAQVEPVLRPYYEANPRQVQSVLAGIRDGAIYETQAGRQGWAMQLWDTYTLVVLAGIGLIFIGSLVYTLIGLSVRPKPQAEGKNL